MTWLRRLGPKQRSISRNDHALLSLKMSVSVVSCIRTYKVILYLERYFKRVSGVADMQMLTAPRSLARQHCYYILELIRRVPRGSAHRGLPDDVATRVTTESVPIAKSSRREHSLHSFNPFRPSFLLSQWRRPFVR